VQDEIAEKRLLRFAPYRSAKLKDFLGFYSILVKVLKEKEITIIHAHFVNKITLLGLQLAKTRLPKTKVVIHYHNHHHYWFREGKPSLVFRLKKQAGKLLHRSDASIGISKSVTASLPFKHNRYTVLNAAYFPLLDKSSPLPSDISTIANGNPIICMFGFDYWRKGVDSAIRELEPIAAERGLTLLIICPSELLETKQEEIKRDFGCVPKWVKPVPQILYVTAYYSIADIFLSASREEGFCLALVEAIYTNTPIVASDILGQNELSGIPHSIFYDPNKPGALREAVLSILNWTASERQQKTAEAHEYVIKTFDLELWVQEIMEIYQSLLQ
jgi:glycosyltransferase involved in cell wall biosynthesis